METVAAVASTTAGFLLMEMNGLLVPCLQSDRRLPLNYRLIAFMFVGKSTIVTCCVSLLILALQAVFHLFRLLAEGGHQRHSTRWHLIESRK